jgi:putative ABC transport system ATP-binding protein
MVLEVSGICKAYAAGGERQAVLNGVTFDIQRGETVALTGESGSGKTTLLHLVAGLDRFDAGEIIVAGRPLSALTEPALAEMRRRTTGLIFQQFNLIPSLTVRENLGFQAALRGRVDADAVQAIAARLGLSMLLDRYPDQLSGGQQQRVAIGRTLAARPPLILADEPTGNLDESSAGSVIDLMIDVAAETEAALLVVTHSSRLAARLGRRLHLASGRLA